MNVGVAFYAHGAERDGIGWATTYLLRHLLAAESAHCFTVLTNLPAATVRHELGESPRLRVVSFRMRPYTLWEQVGLPAAIARHGVEVFHSPLGLPVLCPVPSLTTVHDVCFLTHPETFTRRMRTYFRVFLPLATRRARLVLTVSEASARALVELLAVPRDKIRVVPNGIATDLAPVTDPAMLRRVRRRYRLPEAFVLYVGTLEPRKNLVRLVDACARLWRAGRLDQRLVLVGKRGWLADDLFRFVERTGCGDRVVLPGYVAREDLAAVYSAASAFVYPSLCEGFGLPPLEAMACGTPVVASRATSLPEVLGDAARLVDPLDVDALAEAIRAVTEDGALRARLRTSGLARARGFTWEAAARRMLAVYDEVASGGS